MRKRERKLLEISRSNALNDAAANTYQIRKKRQEQNFISYDWVANLDDLKRYAASSYQNPTRQMALVPTTNGTDKAGACGRVLTYIAVRHGNFKV